jgi:hypothetical protein
MFKIPKVNFRCGRSDYDMLWGFSIRWRWVQPTLEGQECWQHCFGIYIDLLIVEDLGCILKRTRRLFQVVCR